MAELFMTTDACCFVDKLHPGDTLLFDTFHPLSALVKFAENRPVSHCALYLGDGRIAHVTRESEKYPQAARAEPLQRRLRTRHDRTVTAFRHRDVAEGGVDPASIIERATDYVERNNTEYAYVDLIALMVPALLRTYDRYLERGDVTARLLASALEILSAAMAATLASDAQRQRREDWGQKRTLTCSEFVFRCHLEADLPVIVDDPLFSLEPEDGGGDQDPLAAGDRGRAGGFFLEATGSLAHVLEHEEVDPEEHGEVDPEEDVFTTFADRDIGAPEGDAGRPVARSTRELINADMAAGAPHPFDVAVGDLTDLIAAERGDPLGGARTAWSLARMGGEVGWNVVKGLVTHNAALEKYGRFRPGHVDLHNVLADTVTPKDLWSSESLQASVMLHRPPASKEDDLALDLPG